MGDYTPTQVIAVDVESSGLDVERHIVVEAAWINLVTGERGDFVPAHATREALEGEIEALRVNHYVDRISLRERDTSGAQVRRLWEQFAGPIGGAGPLVKRVLLACNPAFDAAFLTKMFLRDEVLADVNADPAPWSHRMRDLGSYAAGVFGLPLDHPPLSLAAVCDRLGVAPGDHSAGGDVRALAECYLVLTSLAAAACQAPLRTLD